MAGLGAASYKLALDAGDVKAGAATAQASFRSVQATFRSLESPLEKLERKLASAEKAQNDFIQGTETWNRAASNIAKLRQEIDKLNATTIDGGKLKSEIAKVGNEAAGQIPVVGRYVSMLGSIHPAAIAAVAGVGLVAGEIVGLSKEFNEIDKTSKAARQTGFDFTTFAAIGRVGALADIENIGGALKSFTQVVGLASLGNEKAAKTFKMLGMDASALSQMDARDRLKAVADKLAGITNHAEKAAIATKLFGDEGVKLAEVLGTGGKAVDDALVEIRRFRLDLTDEQGLAVEATMDAWKDVSLSIAGVFRQAAVELSPIVTEIAEKLTAFWQSEQGPELLAKSLDAIKSAASFASDAVSLLTDKFAALMSELDETQKRTGATFMERNFSMTGAAIGAIAPQKTPEAILNSQKNSMFPFLQSILNATINRADMDLAQLEMESRAFAEKMKERPLTDDEKKAMREKKKPTQPLVGGVSLEELKKREEEQKERDREEKATKRRAEAEQRAALDKIAAMELERQMFGKTSKEIARAQEIRKAERDEVDKGVIAKMREHAAMLGALEQRQEADKRAKEAARKQETEDKRIAAEQKRDREQMAKAARQAVSGADPEAKYREDIKQFTEWLKAKAITIDEFAKLKEEAGKKLAKPIRIGRVDTGVTGIQKGSAEAVELAWRLRAQRKELATPPKAEQTQAEIDRSIATKQAAMEHFGAMIAADKARKDAEAAAIAEADKTVAERDKGLAALGIDQAGIDALNESSWEGASTAPEIAIAREQQRKGQEEAQRQAAAQAAEQARRAAEQAAVQRQYAEGFADLSQRDMEGRGPLAVQPTDAIGNVLRDTITQQNAQQSEEAKDGPKTVGTLGEIRDILRNGQASQITVQEVSAI